MKPLRFGGSYAISSEESQRISALKIIAILFVVMIHAYDADLVGLPGLTGAMRLEYILSQILARSAVPLFFLLSGILLFKRVRSYSTMLREKARTLLLPYVLWNSFWILVFILLQTLPFTKSVFGGDSTPILQRSPLQWLQLYGIGAREPQDYPLWFMRDLMLILLVSPLIWSLANRIPRATLVLSLLLLLFWPNSLILGIALPYSLLAACAVRLDLRISAIDRTPFSLWLVLYGAAAAAAYFYRPLPFQRAVHLLGVLFWLRVSACFRGRPLTVLIKGSEAVFMIFAAHELTLTFLKAVWNMVLPHSSAAVLLGYFLLPSLVIGLCILADQITARFLPRFHRTITGGR